MLKNPKISTNNMGYHVELSVNMLKETKFSDIENTISDAANFYECSSIYYNSDKGNITKISQYQCIFVVYFLEESFDNFIKFVRFIKNYKPSVIECIYDNNIHKLVYASSYYLQQIEKSASKKYKQFIHGKLFTPNETTLLHEFI